MKRVILEELIDKEYDRIGRPEKVLCAVSGGADSVALLCLLKEKERKDGAPKVYAVHVNHGLREASEAEEKSVSALCSQLDVPLGVYRVRVPSDGNIENEARNCRYEALYREALVKECPVIALAHHAADQAETMLMRMMRGCGEGAVGISGYRKNPNGICLWRPLLSIEPVELKEYLAEKKIPWCEDESNRDERMLRNFLRHRILPLLKEREPDAVKHFARSAGLLQEEHDFVAEESEKLLKLASGDTPVPYLDRTVICEKHAALRRMAVRLFLKRNTGEEATYEAVSTLLNMRHGERAVIPGRITAERYEDRIYLLSEEKKAFPRGRILSYPCGTGQWGDGKTVQVLPEEVYRKSELRCRREGDIITPFGMNGTKSLSDYMTDRKIPRPLRDYVPLLCIGNRAVWVIGHGIDEVGRAAENGKNVLLQYEEDETEKSR